MVNEDLLMSPNWYLGTTLAERLMHLAPESEGAVHADIDINKARRREQRWRSEPPFATNASFADRLASDGIAEDLFLRFLGESAKAIMERFLEPPSWLAFLTQAFPRPVPTSLAPLSETLPADKLLGFLNVIQPLIEQARDEFRGGLIDIKKSCVHLPFDLAAVETLLSPRLFQQLGSIANRTMALELNVARLQDVLVGNTPEERFQSFVERLAQRDIALGLLHEYPVLARLLSNCLSNWVKSSLEFLSRLTADWEAMCRLLSPDRDPGELAQVDGTMGDPHRRGRAVMTAKFTSGFQVVYKPRPLAVDVHFQDLLTWLNALGASPPFRILKIIDRGSYGWEEFVQSEGCTCPSEIRNFYERQGAFLALLYALEATDFHFENLIAAGEHPVLLDLEALFHPRVGGLDLAVIDDPASSMINYSVLRVGLLPERVWGNTEIPGIDISGLGSSEGQITPYKVPYWEGKGTDELQLRRSRMPMRSNLNRPKLNGREADLLAQDEAIVEGFTRMYRLLLKHRVDLLAEAGPLAPFGEDEIRAVVRPTMLYDTLLQESFHPDMLRDSLDRDRLYDRLWAWVKDCPPLAKVIPAEREDLWNTDIPLFTTRPDSRTLWTSSRKPIPDFFDASGMEIVRKRLLAMNEEDLSRQLWLIRASLATLGSHERQGKAPGYDLIEPNTVVDHEQLLRAAQAVGDRLGELALRGSQCLSWIGLTLDDRDQWRLTPLETDLYDGLPGVILFLAYLDAVTGEGKYSELARQALVTFRRQIEQTRSSLKAIGGFTGWGGIIYTLTHLGTLWNEATLLREAEAVVELLPPLIDQDNHFDIISGSAGCIAGLICLYKSTQSHSALSVAVKCGERLVSQAQALDRGIGWIVPATGERPLTGFSHGAAGIAWALLKLAVASGEERYRKAASDAIAYERAFFSSEAGNWPDLRVSNDSVTESDKQKFMVSWCHGAPGIGLARLRSLEHLDDPFIRSEIETALQTTLRRGFGWNHCLCHGDLGNLELLLQASQIFGSRWRDHLDRVTSMIVHSMDRIGWLCGNPMRLESPGLMTGLSGIGYELLRLAEPERTPAVLVLQAPVVI